MQPGAVLFGRCSVFGKSSIFGLYIGPNLSSHILTDYYGGL